MLINKEVKLENLKKLFKPSGHYATWRIASILIAGLILASTLFIGFFVYQNIYTTLANTNTIIILESSLGVDVIDTKAYNQVEEKLKLKKTPFSWPDKIRNIFDYVPTSTTISTGTIKKP